MFCHVPANTAIERIKQRKISSDKRVALAVADQNNPYDMVTIRGDMADQITGLLLVSNTKN